MGKPRPGSRKGQTKLTKSSRRSARRRATRQAKGLVNRDAIVHPAMRKSWDGRLSPANNLTRIGLVGRVNDRAGKRGGGGKGTVVEGKEEREEILRMLEEEAGRGERETRKILHAGERLALERMVEKWGENWESMARDLKLNYLQWTAGQLRKKVERMRNILGEQGPAEVVEGGGR